MKVVIPPFWGEFGWLILQHVRYVHALKADEKIVCCEKGMECLFPSATAFHRMANPIPDSNRQNQGVWQGSEQFHRLRQAMLAELRTAYPDAEIIEPHYDCAWHTSDLIKPRLWVIPHLPHVDVVICARKRQFAAEGNWPHWGQMVSALRGVGLTVGVAGAKETSADVEADAKAWEHPEGPTAGTVDLLLNCRLFVGTDTGVSHLAAMMDVPSLIFRAGDRPGCPDLTGIMARANKCFYERLPDSAWDNPDQVLGATIRCLSGLGR